MNPSSKIRVLVVDDSAFMRQTISHILMSDPSIEVVGQARDGREGVKMAISLKPHVITMDIKMPIMDGIDAISTIMRSNPLPIIVASSMGNDMIVKALNAGAMEFISLNRDIEQAGADLIDVVKTASKVKAFRHLSPISSQKSPVSRVNKKNDVKPVIAIGISTGGPQALQIVLSKLPADFAAAILVVQHISKGFISGLVDWLRLTCPLDIRVAKPGDEIEIGKILFAPDDYHMVVDENEKIALRPNVHSKMLHVPSIHELMKSVALIYQDRAIGVLMTGMGQDGVEGIGAIKCAGGLTIAQDEATSAIYGMNKVAIDKGYINKVMPVDDIATTLVHLIRKGER